jgi:hypothetical protein
MKDLAKTIFSSKLDRNIQNLEHSDKKSEI